MRGRKTARIVRMDHGTSHLFLSELGSLGLSLDVCYIMCRRLSMGCNPTRDHSMYREKRDPVGGRV